MTKDESAWVLIRFTGLILLILAILSLVAVVPTIISMLRMSDSSAYGHMLSDQQMKDMNRATVKSTLSVVWTLLPSVIAYAIFALYFLLGGKWVFKLLTRGS